MLAIFEGKFCENFGPKVYIFPKFCHNIQNFDKTCHLKLLTKMKILESIVYVISLLIFWGQGNSSRRSRYFAESFAKTLGKFWENFRVQNFAKTATLVLRAVQHEPNVEIYCFNLTQ